MWSSVCICLWGCYSLSSATLYTPLQSAGFGQDVDQLLLGDHQDGHKLSRRSAAVQMEMFSAEKIRLAVASGDLSVLDQVDWALHNLIAPLNITSHCLTDIFTFFHTLYDMAKAAKTIAQCDAADCDCLDARLKHARRYSWVLRVFDATPRIPSGVLRGNFFLLGSYDVCTGLDVDVPIFGLFICALFALILFGSLFDYFIYRQNMESARAAHIQRQSAAEHENEFDGHIPNDVENPKQQQTAQQHQHHRHQQQQSEAVEQQYIQQQSEHQTSEPHPTKPSEPFSESEFFDDQTTFAKVLLAFSLYTNVRKLFDLERKEGQLFPVHGVRFISLSWVILGHTYYWSIPVLDNLKKAYDLPKDFTNQAVLNASVCVDAFYLLGAMLVVYLFMKEMKRTNARQISNPLFWLMYYLHRYIRYIADGPFWNQNGIEPNYCKRSWWTNAIYLNNFIRLDEQCMSWSWYLANDFQFYAFAPPFLILLWKNEKLGVAAIGITAVVMGVIRATIIMSHTWPPTSIFSVDPKQFDFADDYWNQVYIKPYCRCQPYLVGMLLGYIFYKTEAQKIQLPKWAVVAGWSGAFACCVGTLFGLFDYSRTGVLPNVVAGAIYAGTQRLFWAAGVAWVIFACVTGNGGPVDRLLSWKFWMPLSRLTYCGYLVHPLIVHGLYTSRKAPLHFDSHLTMVYNFLGHVSLSYAVAFVFNLAFEVPILALEEMIFPRHGKKKPKKAEGGEKVKNWAEAETNRPADSHGQQLQQLKVPLLTEPSSAPGSSNAQTPL